MDQDIKTKVYFAEITEEQAHFSAKFPYQNAIGALLYLSINTRPYLSYSVEVLARHRINPNLKAYQAVIRVLKFLRSTPDIGVEFKNNELDLHAFWDADWAGDHDSRQSITDYLMFATKGLIAWQSKLQAMVAASTMEADLMAVFNAVQECVWVKGGN